MSIDIERLKVDESLWPEGANYFLPGGIFVSECLQVGRKDAIPRPTKPEWVDGLPEVGSEAEFHDIDGEGEPLDGKQCFIISHGKDPDGYGVTTAYFDGHGYAAYFSKCFKPIQTPEKRMREELVNLLRSAAREFRHSSRHEYVAGYDIEETLSILSKYNLTEK